MWGLAVSVLWLCMGSAAAEQTGSSGDCYPITPGIMAGIVAADVFLTILLLVPVYCCIRRKDKKKYDAGERHNYMNMIETRK